MSNFISFKRNLQIDETLNSTKQDNTETTTTIHIKSGYYPPI